MFTIKVILAPMAGVTDLPFRRIAKRFGADLVTSEMVSAQGLLYDNKRTHTILQISSDERPVAIQIFGHDPQVMAEAAQIVAAQYGPDYIDINMGCPTPKIVKNGDGAALLKDISLATSIAKATVEAVNIPVTVKTRLGWDENDIVCLELIKRLVDVGVHWVTLHARTRNQFYSGNAHWDWIRRAKEISTIPIIGNGDIRYPEDAQKMVRETGCDHVAIGRAAIGNPWIFARISGAINGDPLPEPSTYERIGLAIEHLEMKVDYAGEERGVREMRPHIAWYLKGVPNSAQVRAQVNELHTVKEVKALLKSLPEA